MLNRRDFLKSMLIAGAAPAIVRAESIMKINPMDRLIIPSRKVVWVNSVGKRHPLFPVGSFQNPFRDFHQAMESVRDGDMIYISAQNSPIIAPGGLTIKKSISIVGGSFITDYQ